MREMTIEEITESTKKEAEINADLEYDKKYTTHLVPVYVVVKTDQEGRISSHTYPSSIPMGVILKTE